jgi:dihydroflavonol-4-reductase
VNLCTFVFKIKFVMSPSKAIFITGATGFLGSYLTRYLVKTGHTNIIALKRSTSRMDLVADILDKVHWVEGDILDVPFLEEILSHPKDSFRKGLLSERGYHISHIFHCAAVVSFDPRNRDEMYDINVKGTANLVNAALECGVEKFIHVSSIAAVGRLKNEPNVSETNKWQRSPLNSHYAISKYQGEQEVWRGIAEGLNAAIVNPSVILGSQFWDSGTGKLFEQVWSGLRFYTEGVTGYVDVRDVVRFMVLLMASDIEKLPDGLSGKRFIINGENLPYKILFEQIADVLGKKRASIRVTPLLRELAWRFEFLKSKITGIQPLITKETAHASATTFYFSNEKSLNAFPEFHYTPIQQTIKETGEQFLQCQKLGEKAAFLPV